MRAHLYIFAAAGLLLAAHNGCAAGEGPVAEPAAANQDWGDAGTMDRPAVVERTMVPFRGQSHPGVDATTLTGKVMCGYQGWFTAQGDGAGRGWTHWRGRNGF